jgi:hypothetical protein
MLLEVHANEFACYERAYYIAQEMGDRRTEGLALASLGLAYLGLGEEDRTREYWTRALTILDSIEDPSAEEVRRLLAELGN